MLSNPALNVYDRKVQGTVFTSALLVDAVKFPFECMNSNYLQILPAQEETDGFINNVCIHRWIMWISYREFDR